MRELDNRNNRFSRIKAKNNTRSRLNIQRNIPATLVTSTIINTSKHLITVSLEGLYPIGVSMEKNNGPGIP